MKINKNDFIFFFVLDSREMPFNERQQVYANGSFFIKDVTRETDEGTYLCTAVNKQREKSQKELHVKVMSMYKFSNTSFLCK